MRKQHVHSPIVHKRMHMTMSGSHLECHAGPLGAVRPVPLPHHANAVDAGKPLLATRVHRARRVTYGTQACARENRVGVIHGQHSGGILSRAQSKQRITFNDYRYIRNNGEWNPEGKHSILM